jgi:hypothetical protein
MLFLVLTYITVINKYGNSWPHYLESHFKRLHVIEVSGDHLHTLFSERLRTIAPRIASNSPQPVGFIGEKTTYDGASLSTSGANDDDELPLKR